MRGGGGRVEKISDHRLSNGSPFNGEHDECLYRSHRAITCPTTAAVEERVTGGVGRCQVGEVAGIEECCKTAVDGEGTNGETSARLKYAGNGHS